MLIATHAAAICDAIAATGLVVSSLTVTAQRGDYGSILATVVAPRQPAVQSTCLLADVGPSGVHAWRWRDERARWSRTSVDTAAEAMQRAGGVV